MFQPKTFFSNINPLLKRILDSILHSKEINQNLFDNKIHYKIFKKVSRKEIERIYISSNYLVIKLREIAGYYIVGINSETGKLFVRGIDGIIVLEESKPLMINDILIELTSDNEIRKFLGYDKELEEIDISNLETPIRIRVQGDIILQILDVNCERMYKHRLKQFLAHHVRLMYTDLLLERLRNLLLNKGIHVFISDRTILIDLPKCTVNLLNRFVKFLEKLIISSGLLTEIEKEFNLRVVSVKGLPSNNETQGISILTTNGYINVDVSFGTILFRGLRINITLDDKIIENKVQNLIEELNLEYRDRILTIGRHIVKLKALPTDIVLKLKMFNRERIIQINNLPLIVKGKIEILHEEHKPFEMTFPLPTQISLHSIPSTINFIRWYNYYKIKELVKTL